MTCGHRGRDHGVWNPEHRTEATRAMIDWFKLHLLTHATN